MQETNDTSGFTKGNIPKETIRMNIYTIFIIISNVNFSCWSLFSQLSFIELLHTKRGTICAYQGLEDLSNAQECSEAVKYATSLNQNASLFQVGNWETYPTGCIIHDDGRMYFNQHPSGMNEGITRSICKKSNT